MRRALHARWILPVVVVAAGWVLWQNARGLHWRELRPGIEFATLAGEPYCRMGSSAVAVLRVDPRLVRVRARHYTRLPGADPPGIVDWQRETGALAVFNAGQFYPDRRYMGLFVSDGDTVSRRAHPGFQAALVACGGEGPRDARVLDLSRSPLARERGWSDVAQSFMLFDRGGGVRVRRTSRVANRTAVAEDPEGHLVVLVTEGGYTLADFAELLMKSPLKLTHAMSMDGGIEAELVVTTGTFRYASFGRWTSEAGTTAPGALAPLPAVITVEAP
jgi:Phosphodiester glycosidase